MSVARYRVNTPNVVHEIIEGEAVIVNLANGLYYSVDRAGADIWALLEQGVAVADMVGALAARYTGERDQMQASVQAFLAQLEAEDLVVPDTSDTVTASPPPPPAVEGAYQARFEPPVLQKYSDMEDLLLLDPLHTLEQTEG